jgi:biopolymer transport protein ExbD
MPENRVEDLPASGEEQGPVMLRRPGRESVEMDITPMIDVTFLLLIFFLVGSTINVDTAVDLPPARHGKGVSPQTAVIITVGEPDGAGSPPVYLADGKIREKQVPDDLDAQRREIQKAVRDGFRAGKATVLIKAGRGVRHRHVARIIAAASQAEGVEGMQMNVAVLEKE